MESHRRVSSRKVIPQGGPPHLSPIDKIIDLHHGTSTAIDASRERLQASKEYPEPSLSEKIEQLQKQYSVRYHEAVYFRQMEQSRREFKDDVSRVSKELVKTLGKLDDIDQMVDQGLAELQQTAPPSPVDRIISLYQDSTADAQSLQGWGEYPESTSLQTIEQLQRQIGRLSQEVASLRQAESLREYKNELALERRGLKDSVSKLGQAQQNYEQKWFQQAPQ